jgi:hypothetical protein
LSDEFIKELSAISSGNVSFEVIPEYMWDYLDFIDKAAAKASIEEQGCKHVFDADKESYYHMCRFCSGQFYDLPSLQSFQYF